VFTARYGLGLNFDFKGLIDDHNMCVITQNKIISRHKNKTNYNEQQRKAWKSKDNENGHKDQKNTLFSGGGGNPARMKRTQSKEGASIYGVDDRSQCVTFSSTLGNKNLTTFREIMKMEKSSWVNTRWQVKPSIRATHELCAARAKTCRELKFYSHSELYAMLINFDS